MRRDAAGCIACGEATAAPERSPPLLMLKPAIINSRPPAGGACDAVEGIVTGAVRAWRAACSASARPRITASRPPDVAGGGGAWPVGAAPANPKLCTAIDCCCGCIIPPTTPPPYPTACRPLIACALLPPLPAMEPRFGAAEGVAPPKKPKPETAGVGANTPPVPRLPPNAAEVCCAAAACGAGDGTPA